LGGYVDIQAQAHLVAEGEGLGEGFFHLAVSSAPMSRPAFPSDNGHRNGQVEGGSLLGSIRTLAATGGGRVWVDNQGSRQTVSILLPLAGQGAKATA
jgi:hypothetical protein